MQMNLPSFQDVAAAATAGGALIAGWQLWLVKRQAATQFEDGLGVQYRQLMQQLPVTALLGESLSDADHVAALPVFFHYIDLCNEQAFLRKKRRVRRGTWREWREGMTENLRRPAFARAWSEIADRLLESFKELRAICPPERLQLPKAQGLSVPRAV